MDTPGDIKFSGEELDRVKELETHYPEGKHKSALLPVLHMAQEKWGWLSVEVMDYVASLLRLQPIEVYEVATFYTMYHMKPVGKYVLEVCRTGPCCLLGAEDLIAKLEQKLGVEVGGTSSDGMFTLKTVECLASCGTAPMMQVGDHYYENLTDEKIDKLLTDWREKAGASGVKHTTGRTL
ncbi:MAG: NAD(P)H-dependent oxidoreductase subunit E [Bacteroidota bacterium]|nr:NAD(P)H-dependent oxidoreductase subunit E [Bacteroidota bacterium]